MDEYYYAVYCDKIKLADHMTLATALLFIKAYVQEYWSMNFVISLHKVNAGHCDEVSEVKEQLCCECARVDQCFEEYDYMKAHLETHKNGTCPRYEEGSESRNDNN